MTTIQKTDRAAYVALTFALSILFALLFTSCESMSQAERDAWSQTGRASFQTGTNILITRLADPKKDGLAK